jgi:hypothetical protein
MRNPWKLINRCVVCGNKLVFVGSSRPEAVQFEGMKVCRKNHGNFGVIGRFDDTGQFQTTFVFPQTGARHER